MGTFDDSQLNGNNNSQNMSGVPYTTVPFTHLSSFDPEQVSAQLGIQPPTWSSSVQLKQESCHIGSAASKRNLDDDYNIDQDLIKIPSNRSLNSRYLSDRERIQLHNQQSWEEAARQDILVVRCRDTTAELYKTRLGSGSKGKCIKMGDGWLSPTEFETLAGRGSSKDWKRSIRFGGHTLQKLIEEGILAPHAISCTCSICCGDSTLQTGPVRLFTPYKRKRRDGNSGSRSCSADRARRSLGGSANVSLNQVSMVQNNSGIMQMGQNGSYNADQFDEAINILFNMIEQCKVAWDQLKTQYDAQRDASVNHVRVQHEMEKREALSQQRAEIITILKKILPIDQGQLVQQLLAEFQAESQSSTKSCSNCGRDAYLECTACRRACYCSTFCQQKDWPQHQHNCGIGDQNGQVLDRQIKDDNSEGLRD